MFEHSFHHFHFLESSSREAALRSFRSQEQRLKMAALLRSRELAAAALNKANGGRTSDDLLKPGGGPALTYDSGDDLQGSMTLPRIEAVLRSEGVHQTSISQQIDRLKERNKRLTR